MEFPITYEIIFPPIHCGMVKFCWRRKPHEYLLTVKHCKMSNMY
jgi:hypothetical protein